MNSMLRITVNRSATGAKKYYSESYYSEGKNTLDYYSEKEQSIGLWGGKAAEKLRLSGEIYKEDFAALCDNLNPNTEVRLTERNGAERRVGYDLTFNASKSVSLAYTFGNEQDKKDILKAFQEATQETMTEIEQGMQTRVRMKGQNDNRETGNIVYGEFTHFTSRPVDGITDPHLHSHCFVFNATYDQTENKWKAGEFCQIKENAPYYEAVFHSNLATKLQRLGYEVEKSRSGFEIKGIDRETIEKFSRRTEEIEKVAREKNISDKDKKAAIGSHTRESKRDAVSDIEQREDWNKRLTEAEKASLRNLRKDNYSEGKSDRVGFDIIAKDAVEHSLHHHLERRSVATDKEILASAIKASIGAASAEHINEAFKKNDEVITVKEKGKTYVTTKGALHEENHLISQAITSKGRFKPINEDYKPKIANLTEEQKNVVRHTLSTSDGIILIMGKAGTGKTTTMKEVQSGIRESGKNIFAFAPSAEASRGVQRAEGFTNAETVAALFHNKELQEKIKGQVVWVDEGGMLSNKDANKLLHIVNKADARLIITGDTKQHGSVERGDAMRIMIKEAGITPAQITKIQRQKNQSYREAVFALGKSDTDKGFRKLDKSGAIHEMESDSDRLKSIAEDYLRSAHGRVKPKEVLVVSPTHAEGDRVTAEIRSRLKERNIISQDDRRYRTFKNLNLTEAEKMKPENYTAGNWIIFNQNVKGVKAGSRFEITGTDKDKVVVKNGQGDMLLLSTDKSKCFQVYEPKETCLSKGDKIRFTGNGKAIGGKHLFNGSGCYVTGFDRHNNIKLSNGSTVSKDFGHFSLGYVVTSHASQGKTVDKVIISQSSMSLRASSKEQFYVSVSRGRQAVSIYTDSKVELLKAVSKSNERMSAHELLKQKVSNVIELNRRGLMQRIKEKAMIAIEKVKSNPKIPVRHGLSR